MSDSEVVAKFVARVNADFPEGVPSLPDYGYRDSLALCAIDSVYSLAARYGSAQNARDRYMSTRRDAGAQPGVDSLRDLVSAIDEAGGPAVAAESLFSNRQVAPGTRRRKAEALYGAAHRLMRSDIGVVTAANLRARAAEAGELDMVRRAWVAEPGLGYASWRYLLMLAGVPGVKIDRMITRYVGATIGSSRSKVLIEEAFAAAAESLAVGVHELDNAIWQKESGRRA